MDLNLLMLISAVALNLILAIVILLNSFNSPSSRYFFLMVLGIIVWMVSNYFSNYLQDYYLVLWFNKLIFISTSIFIWSFLLFTDYFPDNKFNIKKNKYYILLFLLLVVIIISFSNLLVSDISIKSGFSEIKFGWGIAPYIIFFIGCFLYSSYKIINKYFRSEDLSIKKSIRSIFFGFILSTFLGIITNLLFPVIFSEFNLTNFAPLYTVLFVFFIGFAILKYRFLNIKVIATEFFSLFLLSIVFIEIFQAVGLMDLIFRVIVFSITLVFIILLIRSVLLEVRRREEMEELNKKLNKASKELQAANKELKRLDNAKSEFLSIASHQLRTPVTILRGYISMMLEGGFGKMSKPIKGKVEVLRIAADRLLNLIEMLLDISRLEAGKLEFKIEPVDLTILAKNIVADFQPKAKEKKLKLEIYLPKEGVPLALADAKKITEVFSNIVDNALKYTDLGEIMIGFHQEGRSVVFTCQDTGKGIIPNDLSRLFNKFERGTGMMRVHTEGVGLGLYFARVVVENMGGRIWAESPGKGKGSKFSVSLPLADKSKAVKVAA